MSRPRPLRRLLWQWQQRLSKRQQQHIFLQRSRLTCLFSLIHLEVEFSGHYYFFIFLTLVCINDPGKKLESQCQAENSQGPQNILSLLAGFWGAIIGHTTWVTLLPCRHECGCMCVTFTRRVLDSPVCSRIKELTGRRPLVFFTQFNPSTKGEDQRTHSSWSVTTASFLHRRKWSDRACMTVHINYISLICPHTVEVSSRSV